MNLIEDSCFEIVINYIFRCINGYLSSKVRILVTHQLQYLSDADQILVLSEVNIYKSNSSLKFNFIHDCHLSISSKQLDTYWMWLPDTVCYDGGGRKETDRFLAFCAYVRIQSVTLHFTAARVNFFRRKNQVSDDKGIFGFEE